MELDQKLDAYFRTVAPLDEGDLILVAFSGGADSTALLAAICAYSRRRNLRVEAGHIDHQLDPESSYRAEAARRSAASLDLDLVVQRQNVRAQQRRSESLEMAARRVRYRELEAMADSLSARYIATAHHRDDQAETVLLRMATGHGTSGLSAIPRRRGRIVRPLLDCRRSELIEYARHHHLEWTEDPTNRDLETPRNRIRAVVMPGLEARDPGIAGRLAGLATSANRANERLAHELEQRLEPQLDGSTIVVRRVDLAALPTALAPSAVVHLLRRCGARRRPSQPALAEVSARIACGQAIGVDLGGGWRIEDLGADRLRLLQTPAPTPRFAYNLSVPGEVRLDELAASIQLRAGRKQPWMFRGDRLRAGLSLPIQPGERLTIRNRRPGDRVQPLGSTSRCKLKNLLINHGVPRRERDRLPLLCHSDRILWVPGITIDHNARIREGMDVWVAEIIHDE